MALEGNGNYVFDDLTNYNKVSTNSAPNYQTSSASWHSAIVGCVVNMNHHSSVQATTQCSFRPVNSSYNLDELFPFSFQVLDRLNIRNVAGFSNTPSIDLCIKSF